MRSPFCRICALLIWGLTPAGLTFAEPMESSSSEVEERYLISIDGDSSLKLSAHFAVHWDERGEYLMRIVTVNGGEGPAERLSSKTSAEFIQKFRSFDWNKRPKQKAGPLLGCCSFGGSPRIAFLARVDDSYRAIVADGTLMPSLADFLEVIVVEAEVSYDATGPLLRLPPRGE